MQEIKRNYFINVLEGQISVNNNCFSEVLPYQESLVNLTLVITAIKEYFVKKK